MYSHGWYQVAFESDLENELTGVSVGDIRLVLVKSAAGIQAYSANCPHRGANLALGGKVKGSTIVCPFHGYRIGMGGESEQGFCIKAYETLTLGNCVFVRLSDQFDHGFPTMMRQLAEDNHIISAFTMPVNASARLVTENGFDSSHFVAVHSISKLTKFQLSTAKAGNLLIRSKFHTGTYRKHEIWADYTAHTFSPGLIYVEFCAKPPYGVLTGTLPLSPTQSLMHLSLLFPKEAHGEQVNELFLKNLIQYSRKGIEDDHVMWANLAPNHQPQWTAVDRPILAYHEFCEQFV